MIDHLILTHQYFLYIKYIASLIIIFCERYAAYTLLRESAKKPAARKYESTFQFINNKVKHCPIELVYNFKKPKGSAE